MIAINKSDRADVVTLTLNRPEKRNALNRQLVTELAGVIKDLSGDETVQVLTNNGSAAVRNSSTGGVSLSGPRRPRRSSSSPCIPASSKAAVTR